MLLSIFLALFLPCAGMTAIFLVYICLLCHSAVHINGNSNHSTSSNSSSTTNGNSNGGNQSPVKPNPEKGLSPSDLEKIPIVSGKDLVLGTDCVVCLDEIESDQPAKMIPGCNHGFHLECVDAWLSENNNCPVCRAPVGLELLAPPDESSPC